MKRIIALCTPLLLAGCCLSSYTNRPLPPTPAPTQARLEVGEPRGNRDVLVLLALSGGGSRAAYLSAGVMLKLQQLFPDIDILREVDVISSVSGGSLPAAYYAISSDPEGMVVRTEAPLDCARIGGDDPGSGILCNEKKRLIGSSRELSDKERDHLVRALPGEEPAIERLYRLSRQKVPSNRTWDEATVKELMARDYLGKWVLNWFWPVNALRYWFTAYDRSDIMAKTFEDNMYDVFPFGRELTFGDLNPERPQLVINATDGTEDIRDTDGRISEPHFGRIFTFTAENFRDKLNSDIASYSVARAVMASAAFPGAFNYMTLRDFRDPAVHNRYLHLFDGGNADNLGLESVKQVILDSREQGKKFSNYIVILVDAHTAHQGIDRNECNPRSLPSYGVDLNFLDTFDALLDAKREDIVKQFHDARLKIPGTTEQVTVENLTFWHVTLEDAKLNVASEACPDSRHPDEPGSLNRELNRIPTSFAITDHDIQCLDAAVDLLVDKDDACLTRIRDILLGRGLLQDPADNPCSREWRMKQEGTPAPAT